MCEVFHVLPYPGGLFDQPGYVVMRMEKIKIADHIVEEAELKKEQAKQEADRKIEERISGTKS